MELADAVRYAGDELSDETCRSIGSLGHSLMALESRCTAARASATFG